MKRGLTGAWTLATVLAAAPAAAERLPFAAPQVLATDAGLSSAQAADLDADGDEDLLWADAADSRVSWLRNERGFYGARQSLFVRESVQHVLVADFDLDGRLDLVSATRSGVLAWHRGLGSSTTGVPQFDTRAAFVNDFGATTALAAADFNRDGRPDLLAGREGVPALRLFAFTGGAGPGFGAATAVPDPGAAARIGALALRDIDRDGQLDIVATARSSDLRLAQAFWIPRNSNGSFAAAIVLERDQAAAGEAAANYTGLALGDIDQNNGPDVLLASHRPPLGAELVLRLNQGGGFGSGDIGRRLLHSAGGDYGLLAIADLDRDGDADIAFDDSVSGHPTVLDNGPNEEQPARSKGTLPPPVGSVFTAYALPGSVPRGATGLIGDDDLDGDPDLIAIGSEGGVRRYANRRLHGHGFGRASTGILSGFTQPLEVRASADGGVVLFTEFGAGEVNSTATRVVLATGLGGARTLAFGDLDLDGDLDFLLGTGVLATPTPGNQNRLVLGLRQAGAVPSFSTQVLNCNQGLDIRGVAVGLLDGNGLPDVVYAADGNNRIAIVIGPCAGEALVSTPAAGVPNGPGSIEIADLDRDGLRDLLISARREDSPPLLGNLVGWYRNLGNASFGPMQRIGVVNGATDAVAVDFDQDGWIDVASASQGDPAGDPLAGRVLLFRNLGDGAFAPPLVAARDIPDAGRPAFADLDHDGDLDLAVPSRSAAARSATRAVCGVSLIEALGGGAYAAPRCVDVSSPVSPFRPYTRLAVADADRDGTADIVATSFDDGVLGTFFNTRPAQYDETQRATEGRQRIERERESCITSLHVEHRGRPGDGTLLLQGLAVQLELIGSQAAADLATAVVLRRDDGDGIAEPDTDLELVRSAWKDFGASQRASLAPNADDPAAHVAFGVPAQLWICLLPGPQRRDFTGSLRLEPARWRDAAGDVPVLGRSVRLARLTLVSATVFRDGLE